MNTKKTLEEVRDYFERKDTLTAKEIDLVSSVQEAIEEEENSFGGNWSIEDILGTAKNQGDKLTKKEAKEIMKDIERGHDAEQGINWEVISYYINDFVTERNKK